MLCKVSFFVRWLDETQVGLTRDKKEYLIVQRQDQSWVRLWNMKSDKGRSVNRGSLQNRNDILFTWIRELKRYKQKCYRALKILQKGDFWEFF